MPLVLTGVLLASIACIAAARPFIPKDDGTVLAEVPIGARHAELSTLSIARERIDVALPLAKMYIRRARATGDLRYLGYAEAALQPWVGESASSADALVLHATVLQSRHDFSEALAVLARARELRQDDAQAWLISATVLRVLGDYDRSAAACERIAVRADAAVAVLCQQGIRGLTGHLASAYDTLAALAPPGMPDEERAWRASELGEMAVRMGRDAPAERWFQSGLGSNPDDFYIRAAYADLLLREGRPADVLALLQGRDALEPLLLRIAIAQKQLRDPGLSRSSARLAAAFAAEEQRGDGVHRREEARFLLDVSGDARAALAAARQNWQVQHEPDDILVLIRAARVVGEVHAADPARRFIRDHGIEDVRIAAAEGATP